MPINKKYHPDYRALYPGEDISDEVLKALRESDRKIEYMEYDLKHTRVRRDSTGKVVATPPREESLELLIERHRHFVDGSRLPDDVLFEKEALETLRSCLDMLEPDERELIDALYYREMTEREYAQTVGKTQQSVNEQKHAILGKLLKYIEV